MAIMSDPSNGRGVSHIWALPSGSFMGIAIGLAHVKHHSVLEDVLEDIGALSTMVA